jgi:hypothetical protein
VEELTLSFCSAALIGYSSQQKDSEKEAKKSLNMSRAVSITGDGLTFEQFSRVVFDYSPVRLDPGARARMQRAHSVVQALAAGEVPVYGVNTGFGKLSDARRDREYWSAAA